MENLCYGCMKPRGDGAVCQHCGWPEYTQNMAHQLPTGTVLNGQYVVGRVLGQGGFGVTYIGADLTDSTTVAIKEYYPSGLVARDHTHSTTLTCTSGQELFNEGLRRFLREATTLYRLQNVRGIVGVRNYFEANGTAYIVMEYLEGIDLREYMTRVGRPLTVAETMNVMIPVMEALEHVHNAELVHRDISPDNIMILNTGAVKLLDFGTAKDVHVDGEVQHSTEAILKHGFAPMEQYQRRGHLGPWTDVYALCATAYYCLTGHLPPDAPDRAIEGKPLDWSSVQGLAPWQIEALEMGMAVHANNRFQSMGALRNALLQAPGQTTRQQTVRQQTARQQTARQQTSQQVSQGYAQQQTSQIYTQPPKKKKWLIPLVACALVVLVIIGIAVFQDGGSTPGGTYSNSGSARGDRPSSDNRWKNNVLAHYDGSTVATADFYGLGIAREDVATVTFLTSAKDAPSTAKDVSQEKDGSVMAWVSGKDVYFGASGGINAGTDTSFMFSSCENLTAIHFNGAFHTDYVTDMEYMFSQCFCLTSLDLSGFKTSKVETMFSMFFLCTDLVELDLSGWDTSSVVRMNWMFSDCWALPQLDVTHFRTSNVDNMSYMFSNCRAITDLDLSNFDTSKVTNMSYMFSGCDSLQTLSVENFDTSSVTDCENFLDYGVTLYGEPWQNIFPADAKGASADGWQTIGGKTYYFRNGSPLTGKQTVDGETYIFSSSGVVTGKVYASPAYSYSDKTHAFKHGNQTSNAYYAILDEPVRNCTGLRMEVEGEGYYGSNVNCKWALCFRVNGEWQVLGEVQLSNGRGTANLTFDTPISFDAFTAYPKTNGNFTYSSGYAIYDVVAAYP